MCVSIAEYVSFALHIYWYDAGIIEWTNILVYIRPTYSLKDTIFTWMIVIYELVPAQFLSHHWWDSAITRTSGGFANPVLIDNDNNDNNNDRLIMIIYRVHKVADGTANQSVQTWCWSSFHWNIVLHDADELDTTLFVVLFIAHDNECVLWPSYRKTVLC